MITRKDVLRTGFLGGIGALFGLGVAKAEAFGGGSLARFTKGTGAVGPNPVGGWPLKPEANYIEVSGTRIQDGDYLCRQNYRAKGSPRIMLNGKEIVGRAHTAVSGINGYIVCLIDESGDQDILGSRKLPKWKLEKFTREGGIKAKRPVYELLRGRVEFLPR